MCVICVKPSGIELPDMDTFRAMWNNNRDGAGFMYAHEGRVFINKGFMKFDDFKAALKDIENTLDTMVTPMVFHFRIGTHGGNTPQNTHPFPISRDLKDLQTLSGAFPIGVAHNGVIRIDTPENVSDTMQYIMTKLAPIYEKMGPGFMQDDDTLTRIKTETGSKLAILRADGHITCIGDFHHDVVDGCYYSNYSYLPELSSYGVCSSKWLSCDYDDTWLSSISSEGDAFAIDAVNKMLMPLSMGAMVVDRATGATYTGSCFAIDKDRQLYYTMPYIMYALPVINFVGIYDDEGNAAKYDEAGETLYTILDDSFDLAYVDEFARNPIQ